AAIPDDERDGLTPAAPATPAYRDYLFAITGGGGAARAAPNAQDPAFDRFVRAQQTWDRAFACNIARVLDEPEPPLVVGIIGRGHLEFGHGTPFQLEDLGVADVAVLLPTENDTHEADAIAD
ncbi:ChaN family lipoprotein, partial [Proteus mirabilis]|uniref:ChaN family lipoprotein n=1 Tax=Proteus mirabilis TaxID=584 RepID=UPI0013D5EAA7